MHILRGVLLDNKESSSAGGTAGNIVYPSRGDICRSGIFCAIYEPDTYAWHMYHEVNAYMHACMRIYAGAS